ncbi:MAG TPA: hypothetical protein VF577_04950 [Allosphingosinicella sp.]|jgi:hypothetical protein
MTRITGAALRQWALANWFVLVWPALAATSYLLTRTTVWADDGRLVEAATLFDWCITVPFLYWLCYRRTLPAGRLALRLLGLVCVGVWIAAQLVPESEQVLLSRLGWARGLGIALLMLIELRVMIAVTGLIFSGNGTVDEIAQRSGTPPWVARLMLLEARFWRAVWRLIRGR